MSVDERNLIVFAPRSQAPFPGFHLEIVPSIEDSSLHHQALEFGVGALPSEEIPHLIEIIGQELASEVQCK
jgi:hypothetical protein